MRNTTTTVVIAAGVILTVVTATQAASIHVDIANCPGPGNGSEVDPYCSIQTAIDNTVSAVDEVVVAPGTYLETINFLVLAAPGLGAALRPPAPLRAIHSRKACTCCGPAGRRSG